MPTGQDHQIKQKIVLVAPDVNLSILNGVVSEVPQLRQIPIQDAATDLRNRSTCSHVSLPLRVSKKIGQRLALSSGIQRQVHSDSHPQVDCHQQVYLTI